MNPPSFGLTGRVKLSVLNQGKVIHEGEWQKNLWLDQGLNRIAEIPICDCFSVGVKGTGTTPTVEDLSATTNTYSIADGTTTMTRTAGTRDFTSDDVGKLMRFSTSPHAEFTITAINAIASVEVSPNADAAIANKKIVLYSVQQTGLTAESGRSSDYSAVSGENKTVTAAGVRTFTRTFVFPDENTLIETPPSSNTYSQSGNTVTKTAGTRVFSSGDIGSIITFLTSGLTATVTGYTDPTHVTVGVSQANSAQSIRISKPNSAGIETPAGSNMYSRTGAIVSRAAGARDFTPNDVGKYLYFLTAGTECKITVYTNATTVTVDDSGTVAAQNIRLYGFKDYSEVGFSDSEETDDNLNVRVLFSSPARVYRSTALRASDQLKLSYECRLTVSPATAITGGLGSIISDPGNLMSGSKAGKSAIETFATSIVLPDGTTDTSNPQLEPYFEGFAALSLTNDALAPLSGKVRNSSTAYVPLVADAYSAGSFERTYQALFGLNDAIANNWRTLMIYDPDSEASIFAFLFDANQKKDGNHSLSITFKKSWNRDLS